MLDKKDINKYNTRSTKVPSVASEDELSISAGATAKTLGSMVWKIVLTIFIVLAISGFLVLLSVGSFIWSLRNEEIPSLSAIKLDFSSTVYVKNSKGKDVEYMNFHNTENRTWVPYADIPQAMKDAQVAIEDKRFYDHKGVDWYTTFGAAFKLATGDGGAGGSTLTQQLVKNVTGNKEVSILRKLKEIFSALNLEKTYTKDEILEYYLNLVNYGSGANGVQAAANMYFGKDIIDCSIAECAAIAGITQNPYSLTPMLFPENTKARQLLVLKAMYEQEKISKAEYDEAVKEADNMKYSFKKSETGKKEETTLDSNSVWNWYIETLFSDVLEDLQKETNISETLASDKIYKGGLQIYCAMDPAVQAGVEKIIRNSEELIGDERIQMGFTLLDYDGRVQAIVGSKDTKKANRLFNYAKYGSRQPGSSIKPLSVYAPALEMGKITYGTVLKDQPIPNYYRDGTGGPQNYSKTYRQYMNVDLAIEMSQNAPAAHVLDDIGAQNSFDFLTEKLHFTTLIAGGDQNDVNRSSLATGGMTYGVTTEEMAAAFQVFGNGGNYYKPYTYTHVVDHDGNTILDNRDQVPTKVMSEVNANIMNKLLHRPLIGSEGTADELYRDDLDIFGKTGTTDAYYDLWFAGGTPYGVAAIWNGYEYPAELSTEESNKIMWKAVIDYMWENHWSKQEERSFQYSEDMVSRTFCRSSGLLAGNGCGNTSEGWYDVNNQPRVCNGGSDHTKNGSAAVSASPSPSKKPDVTPKPTEKPTEPPNTAEPTDTPVETPPPTEEPPVVVTPTPTDTPVETPPPTETPTATPSPTDEPPPEDSSDPPVVPTNEPVDPTVSPTADPEPVG